MAKARQEQQHAKTACGGFDLDRPMKMRGILRDPTAVRSFRNSEDRSHHRNTEGKVEKKKRKQREKDERRTELFSSRGVHKGSKPSLFNLRQAPVYQTT